MQKSSHLTRAVFRTLIANRPYVSRECLRRPVAQCIPPSRCRVNHQQKRYFLEALFATDRTPKILGQSKPTPKNLEIAIGKLVDLLRAKRSHSRPPAYDQLIDALRFLFTARREEKQALTRNEVFLVTETYQHLQSRELVVSEHDGSLTADDLMLILNTLTLPTPKERFRSDIRVLAELINSSLVSVDGATSKESENAYVAILAKTGSAKEARDAVKSHQHYQPETWVEILKGLINEARDSDFWQLLDEYEQHFGYLDPYAHEQLVASFITADKIFDAQRMYDRVLTHGQSPTTTCIRKMLEMLIRAGKLNSADSLARILSTRIREDGVISSLILYHAAKDPRNEDLRQAVHALLQSSNAEVSITTFNDVIEYAVKQNNAALAQAVQHLAESEGYVADGKTYALRLSFAIDQMHPQQARRMYEAMLVEDIPEDNYDLAVLNKYVAALAFWSQPDYELIMRVADNILERRADLEPEALAGLCHIFLQRGDIDEATGLLRHRIDFYPLADRQRVSAIFRDFITNSSNSAQRAFNAYELFRHAFPETSAAHRQPLMQSFFDRKRPDLACQVFSHMRQAAAGEPPRPDAGAYTKCFEGIAQCRDVDGLQTIHNMLKLDLQVELTTKVRNAMMLANIACQTPWQAIIDHFYKIMDSREGPSYSTFEVAMRACETWPPYGSFEARKIMAVMQSWNLEITKSMYDTYIGVMAGQCEFESAVELIECMEADIGEAPDAFTIGTLYNAIPWQFRKDEVEKWAKQAYPELWEEVLTFGEEIDEEWEVRYFKLDRSIDIDDEPLFAEGDWKPELQRQVQSQIEPLPMAT